MENLKGLLLPNTFNKCGYVGVFLWAVIGVILLGVFAEMDNGERSDFRCKAKLQEMDFVRAKCFEEYDKRHNRYRFPVYGFVLINFLLIGIVSAVYSQVMKSTVDDHQKLSRVRDAERQRPPETRTLDAERQRPSETRRLFMAYCCQLMVRFAFGIVAIVLQTQLLYPSIFPSDFNCDLSSPPANASAGKNSTKYECHNQRAWQKTVSMLAVIVVNGFFAVLIFIEFMAILILRVQRGKTFLKDSEFLKHYLQLQDQQGSQQERQLRPEHVSQQEPLPLGPEKQDSPEEPPQQRQEQQGSQQKPPLLRSEQQVSLEEPQQRGEQQGSQQKPPSLRPEQHDLPEKPWQQRPKQESSQHEPPSRPKQQESPKEPPQQQPKQEDSLKEPPKQRAEQQGSLEDQQEQLLSSFIKSLKKTIIEDTEKPSDLRALFQPKPGEGKRIKDLKIDSIYTKLVLIPNRAEYDFSGNREEQLKVYPMPKENLQPLKNPEEIVDAENKITLMVGRPGIGKTLFCTKFLRDWASDKVFNKTQDTDLHYEMAFLIKFRKFNWIKRLSLREFLTGAEYLRGERIPDEVWDYIRDHPDRVLIFFDGFDEMKDISSIAEQTVNDNYANMSEEHAMPMTAIYSKLVNGKLLSGATIITTTRPNAVSSLGSIEFGKTIEFLGFSEDQVKEYVKNFTKEAEESLGETGEKIWQHIRTNMNLFSLCYVPVNCFIICSCLLQIIQYYTKKGKDLTGAVLPEKFTQIYKIAMRLFFFRHNEQYKDKVLSRKEIESDKFPPEVEEKIFKPLAEVAFNGVKERRLIFGESEVQGLENSGLLHQLPDDENSPFNHEAQFCFIHLTMQEFLAAKHIVDTMNEEKLREFISDNIKKGEWHVVLQFVAGLLGEQKLPIKVFTKLLPVKTEKRRDGFTWWPTGNDKDLALTILKCLFESGENKESHSVVKSKLEEIGFNAVNFSSCRLAPSDCTAVVHALKNVPQISCINLARNQIGSLGCVEIRKLLDNGNCKITQLHLQGNNITENGVLELCNVICNSKLTELRLGENNITDNGVLELCKLINNSKLTVLGLSLNNITNNGVLELCNVITNSKLTELWLSDNNITDVGVLELCNVITNSNLTELYLRSNNITDVGVNNLCDVLTNPNCKLTRLDLAGNKAITSEAKLRIMNANPSCLVSI